MNLESFLKTIKKYDLISRDDSIIAAVSGGADSMAMLKLLTELDLRLHAVHINHGLRGAESDGDEEYVRYVCNEWGVGLDVERVDAKAEAKRLGRGVEDAGRRLRYAAFEKARIRNCADKISVAHNKNDNAETVLMWLLRGAGINGLCGIPPVRGYVIRPLLGTGREEIEAYCNREGIAYRTDLSNYEPEYRRNRLRGELLPYLKSEYNPKIIDTLARTGENLARDSEYLEKVSINAYTDLVKDSNGQLQIAVCDLAALDEAIAVRVIRMAVSRLRDGARDLYSHHLESVLHLLEKPTGKKINLPGGLYARKEYGFIVIALNQCRKAASALYDLKPEIPVHATELGIQAVLTKEANTTDFFINSEVLVYTKEFSYDKIDGILQIRSRRSGDRIYVSSMGGNKKIQDYFTDIKLPSVMRDQIPLIADGSDIVWIIDDRNIVSDRYKAREGIDKMFIHVIKKNTT